MVEHCGAVAKPGAARWSGPKGYTLLFYEVDFRPGGSARAHVRSPEGRDHRIDGLSLEIVEPERVVFAGNVELGGERLGEAPGKVTFRRT